MSSRIDALKQQLQQLDALRADGTLSEAAAASARADLERQLVDAVMSSAPAGAPPSAAPTAAPGAAAPADATPPARPSRRLVAGLSAFVLLFGGLGYAWKGDLAGWSVSPGTPAAAGNAAAGGGHAMGMQQIDGMIEALRQRLKDKPDDAEGWLMLGRSMSVLGRFDEAVPAYRKVLALQSGNAQAMADLADALAMQQKGSFDGEPQQLIEAALKADPKQVKALALAGTLAFERNDFKQATALWERAVAAAPPDSDMAKQLQESLAEARQASGQGGPAANAPAPVQAAAPATPAAVDGAAAISGRVELAPALAAKAQPDDTVFVFARAAEGPRMPLAIVRKQVRDLPFEFTLDDSSAMSPATRLSGAKAVVVGARVSHSGQAMPQSGDLQGLSATVAPGAKGLRIVISDALP